MITEYQSVHFLGRAGLGHARENPFTMSSGFLVELLGSYRLSRMMVQSVQGNNGSLAYFVEYESHDELSVPSDLCRNIPRLTLYPLCRFVFLGSAGRWLISFCPAVVVQTPYSPSEDFSMVARINISSGSVVSILFNKTEEHLNGFIERLRLRRKQTHQCPLSLPAILFEGYGYTSEEYRRRLDAEVVSLEVRTGMTALDTSQHGDSLHISEYERMMRDLHACQTNLIFLANVLNFEMEFGILCGRLFEVFEELRERTGEGNFHTPRARDEFHQHLTYCMNSSRFRQNQIQSLRLRVKSQINVVSPFSLLRDIRHFSSDSGGRATENQG